MTMTSTRPASPAPTPPDGRRPLGRTAMLIIVAAVAVVVLGVVVALAVSSTVVPAKDAPIAQASEHPTAAPIPSSEASNAPSGTDSSKQVTSTFDQPATVTKGITATVTKLEAVQGTASLPGEVAGPSVRVTIAITNDTAAAISLDTAVVNAYYGTDRTPAIELSSPGGKPLTGSVAVGDTTTGTYVFNVPLDQRGLLSVELGYSVDAPIVAFSGAAPR